MSATDFDVIVIGGGPGGHSAAVAAVQAGRRTLLVEREHQVGGACVSRGTIPSKTLRETAAALSGFRRRSGDVFTVEMRQDLQVASLMTRMEQVVQAHHGTMTRQLADLGVVRWHGRARLRDARAVEVRGIDRSLRTAVAPVIVIACGSRPRNPPDIAIDHAGLLDSDSFLSMTYLPASLTVLGAGVIACEYASVFTALGVKVTMIDKGERPLAFLDPALTERFVADFTAAGGCWLPKRKHVKVVWDGLASVITTLDDGSVVTSDKLLCALGRVANLDDLNLAGAGLAVNDRGILAVDADYQTPVPGIYAVGDVIGPPSLASAAMDQGNRAMIHALGLPAGPPPETMPVGIYTIPEMAAVGLTEAQAVQKHGGCRVGSAPFSDLARGQIAANPNGLLKLVADAGGRKLLGVHIIGEGAAELVHLGQMALIAGWVVDQFVSTTFNFPTLAEGYRSAALDIIHQRDGSRAGRTAAGA
jgi:NAD(P) transhydrogenase